MSLRLLELDCNELIPKFVTFLWISLIVSCIGAVVIPEIRSWHRYGKLRGREETEKGTKSFLDNLTVPKQLFGLFYLEGVIWGAIILFKQTFLIAYMLENTVCESNSAQKLFLGDFSLLPLVLFTFHCLRRLGEEYLAPPSSARMHIGGFAVGAMFYGLVPLTLLEIRQSARDIRESKLALALLLVGLLIFVWGSVHQTKCHAILREMKYRRSDQYGLPTGDWFKYSSSPHYLAEILIYFGLLLISLSHVDDIQTNFSRNLLLCLAFTICNLSITAQRTHDWYLQKFKEDYAKLNRWRIIPFVY